MLDLFGYLVICEHILYWPTYSYLYRIGFYGTYMGLCANMGLASVEY